MPSRWRAAPCGSGPRLAGRPGPSAAVPRGEVRSFGPWYIHDVINASVQPAVSVHAYSPPLTSMRRFEFGPGGLERVTMETAIRW